MKPTSKHATRPLAALAGTLAALLAAGALPSCYAPDSPLCTYRCGDSVGNMNHCPDNYECRDDNYCHLIGSANVACMFPTPTSTDMAVSPADLAGDLLATGDLGVSDGPQPDLVGLGDFAVPPDMSMPDLVMVDLSMPDLVMADMSMEVPDMSMPDIAMTPDMSMPDLATVPPDMSMPDIAMTPDMADIPDMAMADDLTSTD